MLKSCFPWSQQNLANPNDLLQLPLRCSILLKTVETTFPLREVCQPQNTELQLRGRFFLVVDMNHNHILSFFESKPSVSVLIKKKVSGISQSSLGKNKQNYQQGLIRLANLRKENQQITFFFDLGQQKLIELYRILPKTHTTQLDFHSLFKPIRVIGQGLTSKVYQVTRLVDNATLAVKAFKKSSYFPSSGGRGQDSFYKEFQFLTQCNHKGICRFEGVYETDNTIYIVQEYYRKSLGSLLMSLDGLTKGEMITFMEDLLRAVHYLHMKGIFHRDIKLDNIMVRKQHNIYRPVIIDLGMAHHQDDLNYLFLKCGTPGYLAPQIFTEGSKDPKGDIFSLGVIFYIILFKKPLFLGETKEELILNNKNGLMNIDYQKLNNEDEMVKDLLLNMLELNINNRPSAQKALQHPLFKQKHILTPQTTVANNQESQEMISQKIDFQKNQMSMTL